MIPLIAKDLRYSFLPLFVVGWGWAVYLFTRGAGHLHPQASYMLSFFLIAGVSSSTLLRLLEDSATRAYAFLRTLPILDREIVVSKFLLSFADLCVAWAVALFLLSTQESSPDEYAVHAAYLTLSALVALFLTVLWHIGIFGIGIGKTAPPLTAFLVVVLLPLSLYLDQGCDFESTMGFPPIVYWLAGLHWLFWLAFSGACVVAYAVLMRVTVVVKQTSEAHL